MSPYPKKAVTFRFNSDKMLLQQFLTYLNPATLFQKSSKNINLRAMHGINRISIFVFLICMAVLLVRWLT